MANIARAYSIASGRQELHDEREQNPDGTISSPEDRAKNEEQDAGRFQAKNSWIASTITQEVLSELRIQKEELLSNCVAQASMYHQHNNHQLIINQLVRVYQIELLIQTCKGI